MVSNAWNVVDTNWHVLSLLMTLVFICRIYLKSQPGKTCHKNISRQLTVGHQSIHVTQ